MLGNIKYQVDEGFYVSWHHFLVIFCQKMTKWHKIMLCIQINRMSLVLLLRFSNQIMCHNLLLLPIRYLRHVTLAVPSPSPGGSPASSSSACCQSSSGASAPPTEPRETSPAPESWPRMFGYTWPRCNLQTLCSNVCWIVSDPSSHQESSPVPPTR